MDAAERLIRSTQALLWDRGYTGTSPKAIQLRAGVGQGSMYHHFSGKPDLALAAIRRSAEQLRAAAEATLGGPGAPLDRIRGYLRRERDVLRGCRIGRLTADPDVLADAGLRAPLTETFDWLRGRLADVFTEARDTGELAADLDPRALAATATAVLQGGYVLARAAGDPEPYEAALTGFLTLLAKGR